MCNLSFPVYRTGAVISGNIKLNHKQALCVSEILVQKSKYITEKAIEVVNTKAMELDVQTTIQAVYWLEKENNVRARTEPTIVIDFPIFQIEFGEALIESRFCITVCVDERKSKCWQRFNLISGNHHIRSIFYQQMESLSKQIFPILLNEYTACISKILDNRIDLESIYMMDIKSAASAKSELDTAFHCIFDNDNPNQTLDFDKELLLSHFQEISPSINELPQRNGRKKRGFIEQLIGFSVGRNANECVDLISNDQLNALISLSYNDEAAHFVCVGYEPEVIGNNFHRSLSHIISGEISTEYGRLF